MTDNPSQLLPLLLKFKKATLRCGITAAFIVCPFFSEEITAAGPVACTITGKQFQELLRNHVLPALQQRQFVVAQYSCKMVLVRILLLL